MRLARRQAAVLRQTKLRNDSTAWIVCTSAAHSTGINCCADGRLTHRRAASLALIYKHCELILLLLCTQQLCSQHFRRLTGLRATDRRLQRDQLFQNCSGCPALVPHCSAWRSLVSAAQLALLILRAVDCQCPILLLIISGHHLAARCSPVSERLPLRLPHCWFQLSFVSAAAQPRTRKLCMNAAAVAALAVVASTAKTVSLSQLHVVRMPCSQSIALQSACRPCHTGDAAVGAVRCAAAASLIDSLQANTILSEWANPELHM